MPTFDQQCKLLFPDELFDNFPELVELLDMNSRDVTVLLKLGLAIGRYDTHEKKPKVHPVTIDVMKAVISVMDDLKREALKGSLKTGGRVTIKYESPGS